MDQEAVCNGAMAGSPNLIAARYAILGLSGVPRELSKEVVPNWREFLSLAHKQLEERFSLGSQIAIAKRLPFVDQPGVLFNPGCFSKSAMSVVLSQDFIEFSFDSQHSERAALSIAILFHEMGHAFAWVRKLHDGQDVELARDLLKTPREYELFADYFAGYAFFFWHHWIRDNLNAKHPTLGETLAFISAFDYFVWTFKYFGCYVKAASHGDFNQRQKAFIEGALEAERTGKRVLKAISDSDIELLISRGRAFVRTLALQRMREIPRDRCN
ncbi:hypothetical protein [Prosthecomicrobium sp. N25]|uniref:hypothetical protein n=1 Tax=Prosthecomicrobium sp. N25 TaxID=3129254 RepID=UPI0030787CF2